MMYKTLRNLLFKLDAESAHKLAEIFLSHIAPQPLIEDLMVCNFYYQNEVLQNQICGLRFQNPLGIGAGFDKNATMIKGLATLGFGFLELGTITKRPQSGNPKPRLFRHIEEKSIQNAMGFNNDGAEKIASRLKQNYPFALPLGVNLGKNKDIAQDDALKDYEGVLKEFLGLGDYFVFNLSSPNTPNLRDLQNENFVDELFCMARNHTDKPLFLKISPDMAVDSMLRVCEKAISRGASGIIATNTTIDYSLLKEPKDIGGISGRVLETKSLKVFKILAQSFFERTTLISVGGIHNATQAYERIRLGASLLQIYSAFIFEGPTLCKQINWELAGLIRRDGFENISEVIGVDL